MRLFGVALECFRRESELAPDSAPPRGAMGVCLYELKRYPEAILVSEQALRINPSSGGIHELLGLSYQKLGRYREAADSVRRALRSADESRTRWDSARWEFTLGFVLGKLQDWQGAVEAYQSAIRSKPDETGYCNLARAYVELDRPEDALKACETAAELFPKNPQVLSQLAWVCNRLERYPEAEAHYKRAIRLKLSSAQAYQGLGIALAGQKKFQNAIDAYIRSIELNLNDATTYFNLGLAYGELKESQKAIDAYARAAALGCNDATVYLNMGVTYDKLKQTQKAIEYYRKAVEIDPSDELAWNNLAIAYSENGQDEKATDCWHIFLTLKPKEGRAWVSSSLAFQRLKRYREALEAAQQAAILQPYEPSVDYNVGYCHCWLEEFEQAIPPIQRSLQRQPENADAHDLLGCAYSGLGKRERAMYEFCEVLRLESDHLAAWAQLGAELARIGQEAEAYDCLKQTLSREPKSAFERYCLGVLQLELGNSNAAIQQLRVLETLNAVAAEELRREINARKKPED